MANTKPMTSRPKLEGGHESDHFETPDYMTKVIVPYLKAAGVKTVWECAAGSGIKKNYYELHQKQTRRF